MTCIALTASTMIIKIALSTYDYNLHLVINETLIIGLSMSIILLSFMFVTTYIYYHCRITRITSAIICTLFAVLGLYIFYKNMTMNITNIFSDQVPPMWYQICRTVLFLLPIAIWYGVGKIKVLRLQK